MGIIKSPLPLTVPPDRPGRLTDPKAIAALLRDLAIAFAGLLRLFEWHEDEVVYTTATEITHGLGRRPFGVVFARVDNTSGISQQHDRWDEKVIVMTAGGAKAITASFVLF